LTIEQTYDTLSMMHLTLYKTIELAGIELDAIIEFTANYVDNGFDHAFGTEHIWEWEIDSVDAVLPDDSVADAIRHHYARSNTWLKSNHKRLRKAIRRKVGQVNRALATVAPDTLASTSELIDSCGDPFDYDRLDEGDLD